MSPSQRGTPPPPVPGTVLASGDDWLTVKELAALMRYDPQTVWRKVRRGEVPGVVRFGRSIRIHRGKAIRWVSRLRAPD